MQILADLKSLGGCMSAMEEKMATKEATEVKQSSHQAFVDASINSSPTQLDQVVVLTVAVLQGGQHIQAEVD